jgi:serine/threonine protein kinase
MKWDFGSGPLSARLASADTPARPNGKSSGHASVPGSASESARRLASSLQSSFSSFSSAGSSTQEDPRVIAALEAYLEALRAGHPWSRDEFLARHSDIAEALGNCLSGLEFIQTAVPQLADAQLSTANPGDAIPPCGQLGEYRILREVGRGGMGVVYEAEQVPLGRRVALKVLPFAAATDPKQRQRFQIEAQAAAQLHHPHIVPIFGVGCDHGIHYYAMQFVDGRSLAAVLHELRSSPEAPAGMAELPVVSVLGETEAYPPISDQNERGGRVPPRESEPCTCGISTVRDGVSDPVVVSTSDPDAHATKHSKASKAISPIHQDRAYCHNVARLGAEAADALEHAHGLGILHRDIKPANLLIDPHGALWITDFGLARFSSDLSLTHSGDMVGTLRYMSPEQAKARGGVVDQRTDIYALGVTLYELLTLQPAFNGQNHQELLRQIALDEPILPRRLNPAVPRDLETIVLKAIAKDPTNRYATAQDLAIDLRLFMDDQPILARRPGRVERTFRWARRHRDLVVTAAAILVLALIVGTAATLAQVRKTEEALRRHDALIIATYPLFDGLGMQEIYNANMLAGEAGPSTEESSRRIEQAMKIFQQAIELPPDNLESRAIIARAYTRLGFARWMSSMNKACNGNLEPRLLDEALGHFRRSIELLEKLRVESHDDPKIRRYMADALGVGGMGCCLMSASGFAAAEPLYRRAIEIRRDMLRGLGTVAVVDGQAQTDVTGEITNLHTLVLWVHQVARLLDANGRAKEADSLRRQLDDDIAAVAARMSKPEFVAQRPILAHELMNTKLPKEDQASRRDIMNIYRLALLLDPENANAANNLAWSLTSVPEDPWFDPARALALAREAAAREPDQWEFLNTLGVAEFRTGDCKSAIEVLQKSMSQTGEEAHDLYFLAMSHWLQGNKQEARRFYERAVTLTDYRSPGDPELQRFRAEAAALLGERCPKPNSQKQHRGKKVVMFGTAQTTKPPAPGTAEPHS